MKKPSKFTQSLDETHKKHGYLQHEVNSVHEIDCIYENITKEQKYADEIDIIRTQHSLPRYKESILVHKVCKSHDKRQIEDRITNKNDKQSKLETKEKQNAVSNNPETNSISEYTEAIDVVQENNIELYKENIQLVNPINRNIEIRMSSHRQIQRQISLPECIYSTPEGIQAQSPVEPSRITRENFLPGLAETYSTAGTFPMPREKEPLLSELEIVGRLPLSQLSTGVRRSRSWYLCCPDLEEEELSRESSWRYSSLRPVTVPPQTARIMTLQQRPDSLADEVTSLRAQRDSLLRALTAERQRAASVTAAQDARLAELHGVIAELLRRRTLDKQATTILEEDSDGSHDDSASTTQAHGDMEHGESIDRHDEDTSQLSAAGDLPTPDTDNMRACGVTDCESSTEVPATPSSPPLPPPFRAESTDNHRCARSSECCSGACYTVRGALLSADRALECYDSILALWETRDALHGDERCIAEAVASQLLHRLESHEAPSHLLSPGPWLDTSITEETLPYSESVEVKLRQHAARLKAETVALRGGLPSDEPGPATCHCTAGARSQRPASEICTPDSDGHHDVDVEDIETPQLSSRRHHNTRHWIETQQTSETDI